MYGNLVWVTLILVGLSVHTGEGIRCWECNSKYDPNCGEPFKPYTLALVDCTQRFLPHDVNATATVCRKITQKVRGETRVVRSCGYLKPEEAGTCFARAGTHLVFVQYCQCATEGCNGGARASPFLPLLLLLVGVFALS